MGQHPYKSWGDVVKSELPELELTKEDRKKYTVDRKMRVARKKQTGGKVRSKGKDSRRDTPPMMMGGIR